MVVQSLVDLALCFAVSYLFHAISRGSGPIIPSIFLFRQAGNIFFFGRSNSNLRNQKLDRQATNSFQFFDNMEIAPPPMIAKLCPLSSWLIQ